MRNFQVPESVPPGVGIPSDKGVPAKTIKIITLENPEGQGKPVERKRTGKQHGESLRAAKSKFDRKIRKGEWRGSRRIDVATGQEEKGW